MKLSKPNFTKPIKRHGCANLITLHETHKGLYKEMNVLYYANPNVAAIMDKQMEDSRQSTARFFQFWQDDIKVKDQETASIIAFELVSSIVDQIVFGKNTVDKERMISTTVEVFIKFLVD